MSQLHEVPLSATEEAFLVMVLSEHQAAARNADAARDARINILLADKGIAPNTLIRTRGRVNDQPAVIIYESPDISGTVPAEPEQGSEKLTAPDAQGL